MYSSYISSTILLLLLFSVSPTASGQVVITYYDMDKDLCIADAPPSKFDCSDFVSMIGVSCPSGCGTNLFGAFVCMDDNYSDVIFTNEPLPLTQKWDRYPIGTKKVQQDPGPGYVYCTSSSNCRCIQVDGNYACSTDDDFRIVRVWINEPSAEECAVDLPEILP